MKKYKESLHISQEVFKEIRKDPVQYFSNKSYLYKQLLNVFLDRANRHKLLYFSQQYLADFLGCSRKRINELIQQMKREGILVSQYRHMQSCNYWVSFMFSNFFIRNQLKEIFSALKGMPWYMGITMLLTTNVTQVKLKEYIYLKRNVNVREYTTTKRLSTLEIRNGNRDSKGKGETVCNKASKKGNVMTEFLQTMNGINDDARHRLSIFPDEALVYAIKEIKRKQNVTNAFRLFYMICAHYCKNKQIAIQWKDFPVGDNPQIVVKELILQGDKSTSTNKPYPVSMKAPPYIPFSSMTITQNRQQWKEWEEVHGEHYRLFYGKSHVDSLYRKFESEVYTKSRETETEDLNSLAEQESPHDIANNINRYLKNCQSFEAVVGLETADKLLKHFVQTSEVIEYLSDDIKKQLKERCI